MNDTTSPTETSADPLAAAWYAKPNDLIGGWCVMDTDQTPAEAQRPEIADFTRREHAEHIADLHNERLARGHWHHAPDGSPYTRLKAYGDGGDTPPSREDVMELLCSYNAANAMNGVHKRTIARLREQLEQAQKAPGPAGETRVFSGYDDDYGIPLFANLADAKAYAEMDREARYPDEEDGDEPVGWVEREARTEHVGYPDMWDMDGGNFVVHGMRVHPSLASALAERPIEKPEPEDEPQIPGPSVVALAGTETGR